MPEAAVVSSTPDETEELGAKFSARLRPGTVVALHGDLGAGKTTFVKGVIAGLGGEPLDVSSPTFSIVNTYNTPGARVHHVDAYRIENEAELDEMGFDEYLDASAIVLIEWPDRVSSRLPTSTMVVRLVHGADETRRITYDHRDG